MDELEAITMLLAKQELETLKFFVEKAEACGSQHLAWDPKQPKTYKMADCNVEFERQEFERRHPALEALATLQFVSFRKTGDSNIGEKFHLTLRPSVFHRVRYERRGGLGKLWERVKLQYKETLGVAGFFISVVLAIIEFARFFKGS